MHNNTQKILSDILNSPKYQNSNKWTDSSFGIIKTISNTHVGSVGQDFIERLCSEHQISWEAPIDEKTGKQSTKSPWDAKINGLKFEIKTATEDVNGNFQFNHIRYHRPYDALLCLGISPENIVFGIWTKAAVSTGQAGHLVTMDQGSSATFKLTKRRNSLIDIDKFKKSILNFKMS